MSGGEVGRGKSAARRSSGTRNTPCRFQNQAFPARHYFGVRDEFTHGGPLTETVLVGAMADHHASEWLDWDRTALKFTNHAKATALVRRAYRDGWQVPGLG